MAVLTKAPALAHQGLEYAERLTGQYRTARARRQKAAYFVEVAERSLPDRWQNVYAFAGADAWECARRRRAAHGPGSAMVLAPGDDPAALWWPPVRNTVLIDARALDRDTAERWARALVRDGCVGAFVCLDGGRSLSVCKEVTP